MNGWRLTWQIKITVAMMSVVNSKYSSEEFSKEECKRRWVDSTSVSDCSDSKIGQTDAIDNMGRSLLGDYVMTEHPIEYQLRRSEFQDCDSDSSTFSNDCQGNLWFVVVIATVGSSLKWIFMTAKMLCSSFLKIVMSLFFKPSKSFYVV